MERPTARLRQALVGNVNAPTVWLTAVFALVGLTIAAAIALAVGLSEVALAAGFVAVIAGVAGSLVPAGLTRQWRFRRVSLSRGHRHWPFSVRAGPQLRG